MNTSTSLACVASELGTAAPVSALPKPSWRDCLHMSPDVAAIVMGVTTAQAEAKLRAAATHRSRRERAQDVAGDFKHSALWQLARGHAPLTQTYHLILNKPVADTYRCRGCQQSQPLLDNGLQPLCVPCSQKLRDEMAEERKARGKTPEERKARAVQRGYAV